MPPLEAGWASLTVTCRTTVDPFPEDSAAYVATPPPAPMQAPAANAAARVTEGVVTCLIDRI